MSTKISTKSICFTS